jgi:hypothetical protein
MSNYRAKELNHNLLYWSSITLKPQSLPLPSSSPGRTVCRELWYFLAISLSHSRQRLTTMSLNILTQTLTKKCTSYPPSRMARGKSRSQVRLLWTMKTPSRIKHALPVYRILYNKRSVTCWYRGSSQNCNRRENRLKQTCAAQVVAWKQSIVFKCFEDRRFE